MSGFLQQCFRLALATFVAGVLAGSAMAQRPGPNGGAQVKGPQDLPPRMSLNFAKFGKGLLTKIDLSPQQQAEIQTAARPRLIALQQVNHSKLPQEEKIARRQEIIRGLQQDVESILTPIQRQRLQRLMIRNRLRQARKNGGGQPAGGASPFSGGLFD